MTKIVFSLGGYETTADATDGESLVRAAVRTGVPGIIGECGGEMSCATCHVYLPEVVRALIPAPCDDELELLKTSDYMTAESRLGCQVKIRAQLADAHIRVADDNSNGIHLMPVTHHGVVHR
jgi:2Fe-2S ferredoxin